MLVLLKNILSTNSKRNFETTMDLTVFKSRDKHNYEGTRNELKK